MHASDSFAVMETTTQATRWGSRSTVASRLARDLSWRIIRGEIPAGELLTEVQVAAGAGISRTPAREAMLQLQAWGLVRLLPKKGAMVQVMSRQAVRDLLSLRSLLETAALATVLSSPTRRGAVVATLRENLARQREALERDDLTAFSACDVDFHLTLVGAGDNSVVDEVMDSLCPRMALVIHSAIRGDQAQARHYLQGHAEIVEHLEAGNPIDARAALEAHIAQDPDHWLP